jgi:hypothetical protein
MVDIYLQSAPVEEEKTKKENVLTCGQKDKNSHIYVIPGQTHGMAATIQGKWLHAFV